MLMRSSLVGFEVPDDSIADDSIDRFVQTDANLGVGFMKSDDATAELISAITMIDLGATPFIFAKAKADDLQSMINPNGHQF